MNSIVQTLNVLSLLPKSLVFWRLLERGECFGSVLERFLKKIVTETTTTRLSCGNVGLPSTTDHTTNHRPFLLSGLYCSVAIKAQHPAWAFPSFTCNAAANEAQMTSFPKVVCNTVTLLRTSTDSAFYNLMKKRRGEWNKAFTTTRGTEKAVYFSPPFLSRPSVATPPWYLKQRIATHWTRLLHFER